MPDAGGVTPPLSSSVVFVTGCTNEDEDEDADVSRISLSLAVSTLSYTRSNAATATGGSCDEDCLTIRRSCRASDSVETILSRSRLGGGGSGLRTRSGTILLGMGSRRGLLDHRARRLAGSAAAMLRRASLTALRTARATFQFSVRRCRPSDTSWKSASRPLCGIEWPDKGFSSLRLRDPLRDWSPRLGDPPGNFGGCPVYLAIRNAPRAGFGCCSRYSASCTRVCGGLGGRGYRRRSPSAPE
mgnify:CR=1 FL=1